MKILIKNKLNKVFIFLANKPPIFYILLSIIINFILLYVCNLYNNPNPNKIYFLLGDANGYIGGCEDLYCHGTYMINDYASRMPGMSLIYMPLRFLFSKHITLTLFIIIQTLLSAISTYLLAVIAEKIFKSKKIFLCVFILYLFCTHVKNYNNYLLSESLATSTLIISLFYLIKFSEKRFFYHLLLSGVFITWSIFLRPFILPMLAIFTIYIFIFINKNRIRNIILFVLPFIIIETLWISRNYYLTSQIIPLQTAGPFTDKYDYYSSKFIKSFGMNASGDEQAWFLNDKIIKDFKKVRPNDNIFSKNIFNDSLNLDSLKLARYYLWQGENETFNRPTREYYYQKSNNILKKFINSHSFFTTEISSRFILLYKFLNQPIGAPLISVKYPFNVILVFFDSFLNYFIILSGYLSLFYLFYKFKRNFKIIILICFMPAFILIFFPFYLQFIEARELTLAFPFLCILSVYMFIEFYKKYKWKTILIYFIFFSVLSINSCISNIKW